jgi:hypothetical protein
VRVSEGPHCCTPAQARGLRFQDARRSVRFHRRHVAAPYRKSISCIASADVDRCADTSVSLRSARVSPTTMAPARDEEPESRKLGKIFFQETFSAENRLREIYQGLAHAADNYQRRIHSAIFSSSAWQSRMRRARGFYCQEWPSILRHSERSDVFGPASDFVSFRVTEAPQPISNAPSPFLV